jgi:hypothetical protein
MYYIISLKHTNKREKFITLWRPNNAGYCFAKEYAGVYDEIEEGYHNGEGQLPIKISDAEPLFVKDEKYFDAPLHAIPNTKNVLDLLNVKWDKDDLVKMSNNEQKVHGSVATESDSSNQS